MVDFNERQFTDESILNKSTQKTVLIKYLETKEHLKKHDSKEELIFFPELYKVCPATEHNCLNLKYDLELRERVERYWKRTTLPSKRIPILSYIHLYNFVEIYLDNLNIKKEVPEQIFLCINLRLLSLNENHLQKLTPSIGRLKNLEVLQLTHNRLERKSLPFTLTFCYKLHTLHIDHNRIVGLPAFLLKMTSLKNIRRLSSKVKTSRIWALTKNRFRNVEIKRIQHVPRLEELSARKMITLKLDYFSIDRFQPILQNVISRCYSNVFICENCDNPQPKAKTYEIITSRFGYLGNHWTIFVHCACSLTCAKELNDRSSIEEMKSKTESAQKYFEYIQSIDYTLSIDDQNLDNGPTGCCKLC